MINANIIMILFACLFLVFISSGFISTDVDIQTRVRRSRKRMRGKKVSLTPPPLTTRTKLYFVFSVPQRLRSYQGDPQSSFRYFDTSLTFLSSVFILLYSVEVRSITPRYQRFASHSFFQLNFPVARTYGSTPINS